MEGHWACDDARNWMVGKGQIQMEGRRGTRLLSCESNSSVSATVNGRARAERD